ncbi:MAG: hypothetical protein CMK83_24065 [Pseudomonadales bacterium]|nr:hypothetical protein [Pseudomonadales bacterium]MBI27133.1 hypothetical protein [Pseudomonadales bacterium]HAG96799.1 hypothetical protein [Gammaproteobacteria bacterium]|tara:strand:+ start:53152 stop:53823 length:672 start_codon:yes stop_codon:yes gene_type:complete
MHHYVYQCRFQHPETGECFDKIGRSGDLQNRLHQLRFHAKPYIMVRAWWKNVRTYENSVEYESKILKAKSRIQHSPEFEIVGKTECIQPVYTPPEWKWVKGSKYGVHKTSLMEKGFCKNTPIELQKIGFTKSAINKDRASIVKYLIGISVMLDVEYVDKHRNKRRGQYFVHDEEKLIEYLESIGAKSITLKRIVRNRILAQTNLFCSQQSEPSRPSFREWRSR